MAKPDASLAEVLRLCTLLADRALDAQIMGVRVPADQAIALAKAAQLLEDHGVAWPPLLTQVLHELAGKTGRQNAPPIVEASADGDLQGLTRFFSGFRAKDRS